MKITLNSILGYTQFYNTAKTYKLQTKTAYKLSKLSKAIEQEQSFYQERLREILNEYALLDDNGNPIFSEDGQSIKLKPDANIACATAMAELENLEVELPDIQLTLDELDTMELTIEEIEAVMPFLAE